MKCPNCGYVNSDKIIVCEKCSADFSKMVQSKSLKTPTSFLFRFLYIILKALLFLLLLGIVIGGVLAFTCVYEVPAPPEKGLPDFVIQVWKQIEGIQNGQCIGKEYWVGPNAGNIEEILGKISPVYELEENIPESSESNMYTCEKSTIYFNPESGSIGDTFEILMEGFPTGDAIEACWYYPDGTLINCVELKMDENGTRKTKFWSEKNDPPGEYRMTAEGSCPAIGYTWTVVNEDNT